MVGSLIGYVIIGYSPSSSSSYSSSSSTSVRPNLLADGGFETGNLQGWSTVAPWLPTVESSIVGNGSSYAARFQTTTNNAQVSAPCLIRGVGCSHLNTSTIYQNLSNFTVSKETGFSMAVYPVFQYPSAFQVSLDFGLSPQGVSRANVTDVIVYYLVIASTQQCASYRQDLINTSSRATSAAAYCLSVPQGGWTHVSRNVAADLPLGITPSELGGSLLTVSVSFAGANSTDTVYVDSLSLG